MLIKKLMAGAVCMWSRVAHAQPTSCNEDEQCSSGLYCGAHSCLPCLRCQDLHRDPPRAHTACVKTITDCGACYKGLVDLVDGGGCVSGSLGDGGTSPYVWVVGGVVGAAAVLLALVTLFVYVWRKPETIRSMCASVHIPKEASAPPPPTMPSTRIQPLNAHPPNVHPPGVHHIDDPPPYDQNDHCDLLSHGEGEDSLLLQKPRESPEPLRGAARETAGRQDARPFDPPNYVRPPPAPEHRSSADMVTYEDELRAVGGGGGGGRVPFEYQDDETVMSPWRPGADAPDSNSNDPAAPVDTNETESASGLSHQALVAVRRASHSDHGPPAKILCVEQDTNNNRSSDASSSDDGASASAPGAHPPHGNTILINVNLNAQQVNNFKTT